jgi:hypothetical protein
MAIARLLAALYLPRHDADLVPHCNGIITAMTGNSYFVTPAPTPALTVVSGHVLALQTAISAVMSGSKGTIPVRKATRTIVVSDMHQLKAYVQGTADANPAKAERIITSALMGIVQPGIPQKQIFFVERGELSGQAILHTPVIQGASYEWAMSLDQRQWTALPSTKRATVVVNDLTPLTTYAFRHRAVTWDGLTEWSHALSLLVL